MEDGVTDIKGFIMANYFVTVNNTDMMVEEINFSEMYTIIHENDIVYKLPLLVEDEKIYVKTVDALYLLKVK